MTKNSSVLVVTFFLFLISFRITYDFLNGIEYHYEEAQYWVWSQNPSLSYLTKGPFVASIISLSNSIFGQSYLGLKFFSLLAYIGTIIFMSYSSIALNKDKNIGVTALLITGLSPAVFFLGGVASTDVYLFFFWSLALFGYIKFYVNKDERWFYLISLATGLGLLTKLSMALLPTSILIYFLVTENRKYFYSIHLYFSALLAILIASPIIIWNIDNDWLTLSHEMGHLVSGTPSNNPEILLMTMIVTIPSALLLFIKDIRAKIFSKESSFLLIPFLIMFSFLVLKSFSGKIQLNWTIPLFLTLVPLLSYAVNNKTKSVIALSFFILSPIFLISNKQISSLLSDNDPLHPMRGWNQTYEYLFKDETYNLLSSSDYKLLSTAAYFLGEAKMLRLEADANRRLAHYDLWNRGEDIKQNILHITYSDKLPKSDSMNCVFLRSSDILPRKRISLYNCTSK